eukprot:119739_1
MPNVKSLIADRGMTLNNAFATTPVCCPSRTETVAGRHYHNVQYPRSDCQGVSATYNVYSNPQALFPKFHDNGYVTAAFGKVTNSMDYCNSNPDLSAFDRLHVSCNYRDFFEESFFNKYVGDSAGKEETPYVQHEDEMYQTAQLGNASVSFIKEQLSKQYEGDNDAKPFIMWVAPYAPHSPAAPAPWHKNRFPDVELYKTPNYDCDVSDYHPPLNGNPQLTPEAEEKMLLLYKDRLQSLLAVDDMMKAMVETVDEYDGWDNTYIVYASDHGYHIGNYRLPCEKYQPYEETIRIPLFVRGPDVAQGESSDAMISNVDFLPTFLDLAGISYGAEDYDGRSWKDIVEEGDGFDYDTEWRQTLLFEYKTIKGTETGAGFGSCAMWDPERNAISTGMPSGWILDNMYNSWRVLRIRNATVDWMYGEFVDMDWDENAFENPNFYEFYDLRADPYQLTNLYRDRREDLDDDLFDELHGLLMQYGECEGASSCSPIGSERPGESGDSEDFEDSEDDGNTKGGGKGGKSSAHSYKFSVDKNGYEDVSVAWSAKDWSVALSCGTVIGLISLVLGLFIGIKLQERQPTVVKAV